MANIFTRIGQAVDAFKAAWMFPGKPMKAQAPEGTEPRQFQYPAGFNLQSSPRANEPISFEQLRALADNYDLLRLAIETRKDQVETLDWNIVPKDRKDKTKQARIDKVKAIFRRPDRRLTFSRWARALVEEVLVIDAPAIYIRRTRGGGVYSLDLIDGATIKPCIDDTGRTPAPPVPAYQQILYGIPAIDLKTNELLYMPRNPRVHKVLGYGNVEQIIMTVNIALRRQLSQLGYYTEGNIPDAFVACPESWTMDQIAEFQAYFDTLCELNPNVKRKARFIPHGTQPIFPKENPLKDEYDEWLARVISYCLSLPPTALVKETNRAVAQTTQEAGKAEGLAPLAKYLKELFDLIIQDPEYMNEPDLEFVWYEEEAQDPMKQAEVNEIYLRNKVLTPDEVREDIGREPFTEEQRAALSPPAQPPPAQPPPEGAAAAEPADTGDTAKVEQHIFKVDGAGETVELEPLSLDDPAVEKLEGKLYKAVIGAFDVIAEPFADQVAAVFEKAIASKDETAKLDEAEKKIVTMVLDELNYDGWSVLFHDSKPVLEEITKTGAYRALKQIGVGGDDITKLVNTRAAKWAEGRAAEMVGMKMVDGELVPNPNAKWVITEGTRDYLRGTIAKAVEEGWSPQRLAKAIAENKEMWEERAENIARTELAQAHSNGSLIGWRASGVVEGKRSLRAGGEAYEGEGDPCQGNADVGVIGLDEQFPSGHDCPPYHNRCKCVVIPAVKQEKKGN